MFENFWHNYSPAVFERPHLNISVFATSGLANTHYWIDYTFHEVKKGTTARVVCKIDLSVSLP